MRESIRQHRVLCIVCPEGCELEIREKDGQLLFPRRGCQRGREYARQEIRDPRRVLTTTVRVQGGELRMLPVRTASAIPRGRLIAAMDCIAGIEVQAPVEAGQLVCSDVAGTGVGLVACRSIHPSGWAAAKRGPAA